MFSLSFPGYLRYWETGELINVVQGLEKVIPGSPKDEVPVHLRKKQIFANAFVEKVTDDA